jgi:hypothetical protein
MRFEISRASLHFNEKIKPCNNAIFNKDKNRWEIEINTVEELVNLDDDGVVVSPENQYNPLPTIIIYDDYIE